MAGQTLTVDSIDVDALSTRTNAATAQRGRAYFNQGRARIVRVEGSAADLTVTGTEIYHVRFWRTGGHVSSACDCPVAEDDPEIACKHQIAAALALRNHLRLHPPLTWETVLAQAVKPEPRRGAGTAKQILLFSLQTRHSTWYVYPYSLPLSHFSEESLGNPESLARTIKTLGLSRQAKPIRSQIDTRRFVGAAGGEVALNLVSLAGQVSYSYYYDRAFEPKTVLPLLAGGFVFRGREQDPLQFPLTVSASGGVAQVELHETPGGMSIEPFVLLGERKFPLTPEKTAVVSDNPLWLLSGTTLYPVEAAVSLVMTLLDNPDITIPPDETETFLDEYLLPLAERVPVTGDGIAWEEIGDEEPLPRLYLSEEDGAMLARLRFGYADQEVIYDKSLPESALLRKPDTLTLVRLTRKPEREQTWWQSVSDYGLKRGPEPDQFVLRARTDPVDFLLTQIPRLSAAGFEVYGERELTTARINRSRPSISFKVSSGIDWFDVAAVVSYGDIDISLKDVRRAVRRQERYVKLADGSIGEIPLEWLEKYRYLFSLADDSGEDLRLASSQITLLDQLLLDGERVQTDDEFQRRRERLRGFEHVEAQPLPTGLKATLHPYQKAGVDWLHFLHDYGFGGCLADDMGLGKTVQCLAFLQSLAERHEAKAATLLVLPRSLIFNWEREAARFTPGLRLLNHAHATRVKDLTVFDEYDLVLTTYGTLLRDIELLRKHRFHYVILDEAQAIKNPLSQSAKAVRLLQSDHRLTLTGTPVENSTLELWSQFSFLNPGLLGTLDHFRAEFAGAIEKRQDETAAAFLRRLVHPFLLRRTKDQVATELPPRTERIVFTEMEPAQRKLYDKTRDKYRAQILGIVEKEGVNDARMKILEGLLRLRQISNHPRLVEPGTKAESAKLETLLETLDTLRSEGHKALVFSQFVGMLHLVRDALDTRDIPYAYLDGKTKDRQAQVDTFQSSPELPFFLISLRAGGVGLNLTAADYVIHIDPWWNPAVEMQATDRTHRIGQDKPVFVYKLIAKDSVEEKILQLQDRKRALVSQLIATETGLFKSLTRQDIELLFE